MARGAARLEGPAYVVGGTSGIGLATARLLASRGIDVWIFGLAEGLAHAEAEVAARAARGTRVRATAIDVTAPRTTEQVLGAAMAETGAPALLVHCVGRARPRPFAEVSDEQFDETMKINVYGTWHVLRAVVPRMRERGTGRIAIVSSLLGLVGCYGYTDYCASKFALIGLGEALRTELAAEGITVSVLCPPDTDTPGLRTENLTKPKETVAISGATGVMPAEDVAAVLLDGVARGQHLIMPPLARVAYAAKRLLPGVVERYMLARIRSVRRGAAR